MDGPAITIVKQQALKITVQATSTVNSSVGNHAIQIVNGHLESASLNKVLKTFGINLPAGTFEKMLDLSLSATGISISGDIMDGELRILTLGTDGKSLSIELVVKSLKNKVLDAEFGIKFNATIDLNNLTDKVKSIYESIHNSVQKVAAGLAVDVPAQTVTMVTAFLLILLLIVSGFLSAA